MLKKNLDIGIEADTKTKMIELLNARLAEAIDLTLITKQAHWNLKGPTFIAVHEFLDELREDIDEHVDIIAERVAQPDGVALGTIQTVAKATSLKPYPIEISKVEDHSRPLSITSPPSANRLGKLSTPQTMLATPTPPTSSRLSRAASTRTSGSSRATWNSARSVRVADKACRIP